jgi:hypothetical protein
MSYPISVTSIIATAPLKRVAVRESGRQFVLSFKARMVVYIKVIAVRRRKVNKVTVDAHQLGQGLFDA